MNPSPLSTQKKIGIHFQIANNANNGTLVLKQLIWGPGSLGNEGPP
jgi:hypothetical protein